MLAVKANYQNGKITFLEDFPGKIRKARLTIIIEPEDQEENYAPMAEFGEYSVSNEAQFEYIGLAGFFDNENDKNINWEDYFGLK